MVRKQGHSFPISCTVYSKQYRSNMLERERECRIRKEIELLVCRCLTNSDSGLYWETLLCLLLTVVDFAVLCGRS